MKKRISKVIAMVTCIGLLLTACGDKGSNSNSASGQTGGEGHKNIKLRIAHLSPEVDSIHQGFLKFKETIEAENVGVEVEIYPAGQITSSDADGIEGVKLGEIDMTSVAAEHLGPHINSFYVFNGNYLFDSMDDAKTILDGSAGEVLRKSAIDKGIGIRVGTFWGGSVRGFWNIIRPVRKVEDYKGLKIRVAENPINVKEMEALGAIPTPMAWSELYTALQQGTVEGIPGNISAYIQQGIVEVLKYFTTTNHSFYIPVAIMSQKTYDKFDDDQKAAFDKAMKVASDYQWELAAKEADDALVELEKMESEGKVEIIRLTDEEREEIKKVYLEATEEMVTEKCGEETLKAFRD